MAEFYVSVSRESMAQQIAALVNQHNKLYRRLSPYNLLRENAEYFVEVVGDKVVGCVGLSARFHNASEIKHVCVDPAFRRKGIGRKLVKLAMANCKTENVYMTIRDDNLPSLMLAKSLGFMPIRQHWSVDHFVITVGRKRNDGQAVGR